MSKKSLFFEVIKRLIKKTKLRTLFFLVILLSFNTTAWFIFATKVDNSIGAKIVAWNVAFVTGEEELLEYVNFKIDSIYPGMTPQTQKIEVTNKGESIANLLYEIKSARILDNEYIVDDNAITSSILLSSLVNDYPFKIKIGVSSEEIKPGENAYYYVTVSWDYETGNDEQDSYWGSMAYDFNENNHDKESIELDLVISAVQKNKVD